MKQSNRRDLLIRSLQLAGGGLTSLLALGCRPPADLAVLTEYHATNTVTLRDLQMWGYSFYQKGTRLGANGILPATVIRDNRAVELNYTQDNHGHKFTLTPDHLLRLRRGEAIKTIVTTEAQGHVHYVWIDPKDQVAASTPVTMSIEPEPSFDHRFVIYVTDENPQQLYLAIPNNLPDSVKIDYCRAAITECQRQDLWVRIRDLSPLSSEKGVILVAPDALSNTEQQLLHIRAMDAEMTPRLLRSLSLIPL